MADITGVEIHCLITVQFGEHYYVPASIKIYAGYQLVRRKNLLIPHCIDMILSNVDPKEVKAEVIAQAGK